MRLVEKALIGAALGVMFPALGFIAGWWATFSFLPDKMIFLSALVGLLIGILIDVHYLNEWVGSAYAFDLKIWMAVYLFYSICMYGFFMGVPVFNVILAIPVGLFIGRRLTHLEADRDEMRRMKRSACIFTTCVLAALCAISAVLALSDPYTSLNLQGMLGLPYEITRSMLTVSILIGGIALLIIHWWITGKVINLTYNLMRSITSLGN